MKYGGMLLKFRLLHLMNECWQRCTIPDEWLDSLIIPCFKKGDRSKCHNCRGICVVNSSFKLFAKIVNNRIAPIADCTLPQEQQGFRKGRSTIDDIFTLKQIIEKRVEFNRETHLAFVDIEKAFDNVNRCKLWSIMKEEGYPSHLVQVVKSMYDNTNIAVKYNGYVSGKRIINKGVRQGDSLSPTLFNIYLGYIIKRWKNMVPSGIHLGKNTFLNTLLYADDQVILQENEDNLQISIYQLEQILKEYNLIVSVNKTKVMAFKGKESIRTKIVLQNMVLEQVTRFNYLGCEITYGRDRDITSKIHKFQAICGTINRTFKKKARKETLLKFYDIMALPVLLYGCETWVQKQEDCRRLESAEMRFLRGVKGCTLRDQIKSEKIREELGRKETIHEKIKKYRQQWVTHIENMPQDRLPVQALNHKMQGKRNIGRPRMRWKEGGTGNMPNP